MTERRSTQILIVEDVEDLSQLLAEELGGVADTIHVAANGEEGLARLKSCAYQAVLTDIAMPKLNGLDMMARAMDVGIDVPFIVLTGFGDKERVTEALRLGAHDFLDKPFRSSELRKAVAEAIELGLALENLREALELAGPLPHHTPEVHARFVKLKMMFARSRFRPSGTPAT